MIRSRLAVVLAETGINLTELEKMTGIALNNLSILKTGKAKAVRFSTLDEICKALQCQPGDLLEYVPDNNESTKPNRMLRFQRRAAKALFFAFLAAGAPATATTEQALTLHLECLSAPDCLKATLPKGEIRFQRSPSLVLGPEEVEALSEDRISKTWNFTLTPNAAQTFSQLTRTHLREFMAVYYGDVLLMAPRIVAPIEGRDFMIEMSRDTERDFRNVPWVTSLLAAGEAARYSTGRQRQYLFVTIAIASLIGAAGVFSFSARKRKRASHGGV